MGKSSEWDFDAPKFWDLTETDDLNRPTDSWFETATASPASFGKKIHTLQPFFPAYSLGEKSKLFPRPKGTGIMRETSQRSQYRAHNSRPNQDNIHLRNNDIDTTCDSLSFSPLHTPLQPEHTRSPMTVEMGRNRAYNDDQDGYQGTKQGDQYTAEEMEVKRKYIYMSYDRMHETIKKAKLVLEESRQKSEQWVLFKKKIA